MVCFLRRQGGGADRGHALRFGVFDTFYTANGTSRPRCATLMARLASPVAVTRLPPPGIKSNCSVGALSCAPEPILRREYSRRCQTRRPSLARAEH